MNPYYQPVAQRAKHRCEYCHAPEIIFNFPFEVEHIIPLALDGSDSESNLALACRSCNLYKSSHITGIDPDKQLEITLFHPRKDDWNDHFTVDMETGQIAGLTPTGKATISRLQMNKSSQLMARKQWILLELFP